MLVCGGQRDEVLFVLLHPQTFLSIFLLLGSPTEPHVCLVKKSPCFIGMGREELQ